MRRGSRSSPESEQRRRDSTLDIADYLKISVHTVQSHLRNIFTKPEYAPRCDLVTKIFFAHYEPRLRDNEQRTAANLPLRGGRLVPTARIAAPAGHRLSQQQSELRARQSEDRFGPMLALTRPQL